MTYRHLAVLVLSSAVLVGCTQAKDAVETIAPAPDVVLTSNVVDQAAPLPVDTVVTAQATEGTLEQVNVSYEVKGKKHALTGEFDQTRHTWKATELLEPDTAYTVTTAGTNADADLKTLTSSFTTAPLTLDQQVYPSIAPLQGEKVGVGMPIIMTFDRPVKDRAAFERKLSIESSVPVEGSWSWLSNREVHFRPRVYWPAGTKVTVVADLNGVNAGDGLYGQLSRRVSFTIGASTVSTVNVSKHVMIVRRNGVVVKRFPITTGKAGFVTRGGTKVIMEKHSTKRMDAATTGAKPGDADYYNIPDVRWAMRLTNSGEFVHAAPWSAGSQGAANVSHGCVGMSTVHAKWLYDHSRRGDVMVFKNSPRSLEQGNGWTDWDVSYDTFTAGSAL
ncbi:Ig-like domain-containing protein [soil metagenome]